jgi:proteasome lid subunit RPN8/RPN11
MTALRANATHLDAMRVHAAGGYPEEICGVLLGRDSGSDGRTIDRIVRVANARTEERGRRYTIPAESLRDIERDARADGLDVIGFYHSHPDHPAEPSVYDREHSWPWYTYVIVSVQAGDPVDLRAWRLQEDRSGFEEERVEGEGEGEGMPFNSRVDER